MFEILIRHLKVIDFGDVNLLSKMVVVFSLVIYLSILLLLSNVWLKIQFDKRIKGK
jgi:hypothetical protein